MKKILLAMLLSVFLLSAITVPSLSQDVTVGVSVGDTFTYEGTLVKYEADEGVPFPPNMYVTFLEKINVSDWERLTVTDVFETTITFESVTHHKDGTEVTQTFTEDITSWPLVGPLWIMAIGANLTVGDEALPPLALFNWPAMTIKETVDIEYEDVTRETNYCEWNTTAEDWKAGLNTFQSYFDKATGILVKYMNNFTGAAQEGNVAWESVYELVDASIWVIPEFPTGTVMLLMFVAVTVCVDICRRKKLKRRIG